jgi:hypothetical protein
MEDLVAQAAERVTEKARRIGTTLSQNRSEPAASGRCDPADKGTLEGETACRKGGPRG